MVNHPPSNVSNLDLLDNEAAASARFSWSGSAFALEDDFNIAGTEWVDAGIYNTTFVIPLHDIPVAGSFICGAEPRSREQPFPLNLH